MGFDQNLFNGVIIEFLSASVKNVDEVETCWRQMQASIGNMDEVINAYALRWRLHTVDDDMKERLNRPKYIDCGPGKCGSTVVIQDGCKNAIVPREELLGKRKWVELSSSKKQMLVRSSPFNEDNKICNRCYVREVRLKNSSLQATETPSRATGTPLRDGVPVARDGVSSPLLRPTKIMRIEGNDMQEAGNVIVSVMAHAQSMASERSRSQNLKDKAIQNLKTFLQQTVNSRDVQRC